MNLKLLLSTLVIAVAPTFAAAMCSGAMHEQTAMSCPEGQSFDAESQSCKAVPTG